MLGGKCPSSCLHERPTQEREQAAAGQSSEQIDDRNEEGDGQQFKQDHLGRIPARRADGVERVCIDGALAIEVGA